MKCEHPEQLLALIGAAGLKIQLLSGDGLMASPSSALTEELRALIRANKQRLIDHLHAVQRQDAEPAALDPDRHCWPVTDAMNTAEINLFEQRQSLFAARGFPMELAERIADHLVKYDRSGQPWKACMACRHLAGTGPWECRSGLRDTPSGTMSVAEVMSTARDCSFFEAEYPQPTQRHKIK